MLNALTAVDAVVFDIGGVFLVPHPEPIAAALADAELAVTDDPDHFRAAHYHGARGLTDRMLAGDHVDEADLDAWRWYDLRYFAHLGLDDTDLDRAHAARALQRHQAVMDVWRLPLADNIDAFHRLAEAEVRLAILSNNDGTAAAQMAEHDVCQVGPGELPEVVAIVDSTVVGVAKPDPRIFELILDALGLEPHRVLYVGDTVHADVRGATAAGLPVVQLDPHELHTDFDHWRLPDVTALVELLEAT